MENSRSGAFFDDRSGVTTAEIQTSSIPLQPYEVQRPSKSTESVGELGGSCVLFLSRFSQGIPPSVNS